MDKKVYVTLENGKVFEGYSFGAEREVVGELVFTTGMTGYIETLTDPSYYGQIVTQTFPLIGNYGMIPEDCESGKCWVSGYIVREKCDAPSNFRCQGTLEDFLKRRTSPRCTASTRANSPRSCAKRASCLPPSPSSPSKTSPSSKAIR